MVAKDFCSVQEAGNYEESTLLQDPYEEDEALSLCDLPIYSGSAQWDDSSKEEGHNSPSNNNNDDGEDNNDSFEFFSEDFTTSTRATAENIIFCGKLIPFKDPPPHVLHKQQNFASNTKQSSRNGVLLPWRPNSSHRANPTSKKNVKYSSDGSFEKGPEAKGSKNNFSCDYSSGGKVSLVRSNTKSRWYLFMFGLSTRLSTEMELSDIRSRQGRRGPATMFPAPEHGEVGKSKGRRNSKVKGLWRMLRSFGSGCKE